jgi:N-acetylmuramic acid 6-phosphate etherase
MLRIECTRCARKGRYSVAKLLAQHGHRGNMSKAGTAQRVALNVFSSVVMILLGRVYGGLMVDLQAVNQKLVRRSESILTRLTGCSGEQACEALRKGGGNVKLAVLLLHGCDLQKATSVLDRAGGQLRAALAAIGKTGSAHTDLII